MTTRTTKAHELRIERTLEAPVERVWAALTEAGRIPHWYGPNDDFHIEVLEWDCRPGGRYRVAMHHKEGQTHTCYGEFRDIEPERRVAYTWSWEGQPPMDTLVTFALSPNGSRTHLSFSHVGFPAEEARDQHETGWTGSLGRLERTVA